MAPSRPFGFEYTKSVRNSVFVGTSAGFAASSRPSMSVPRPGMTGPASLGDGLGAALSPADGLGAAEPLGAALAVGLGPPPSPLLPSGAMVGSPASPSASLTSLRRSAMGDSTASLAAVWMVGFSTNSHRMT